MTTIEYVKSPICIGFTEMFKEDVSKRTTFKEYVGKIMGIDVSFKVYLSECFKFPGCPFIYTDTIEIDDKLPMRGWGSCSHEYIASAIDNAIADFSTLQNVTLCNKINSWPFGVAIATRFK